MEKQIPEFMGRAKSNMIPTVMNGTILYAKNMFVFVGVCFVVVISTILILKDYKKMRFLGRASGWGHGIAGLPQGI